jgi:hypothetical protein
MSTIVRTSLNQRNTLLRFSLAGGTIIGLLHLIIQDWLVFSLLGKTSLVLVMQYVASGAIGTAAFAGGLSTALLGVIFHFLFSIIIAGVFFLGFQQIPLLRRNILVGSLLYGLGVFIVMYYLVIPLSAAPLLPTKTMQIIELGIEHILVIGLPLGLLVRSNTNTNH